MSDTNTKKEFIRSLKFLMFSVSAGLIQIVSFALLNELAHLHYWTSYLVSLVLSVLWNFTMNRKYTFHATNNVPLAMVKVGCFYAVFTPLSTWWTAVLTEQVYGILWNEYLVLALTMIVNFVTEYFFDRFIVFGKSTDTAIK